MKYFITFISLIILNQKTITLKEYYCGEGVIFDETITYPFKEEDRLKFYMPDIKDIKKGEEFIFNNFYEYEISILNHFKLDNSIIKTKYKKPENVKKKFYKYNRQYISYINTKNDTILYIGLLNFSNKKKANLNFDGWKNNIFIGAGDYYYENQKFYIINLSKKKFIYKVIGIEN